jgi:hypothetical protein
MDIVFPLHKRDYIRPTTFAIIDVVFACSMKISGRIAGQTERPRHRITSASH